MNITVVGTGYVGLSMSVLLAQNNSVTAVDIIEEKVEKINKGISPIADEHIEEYLKNKQLNLKATVDGIKAYENAEFVIISTPTNYDDERNFFDTSSVETVAEQVIKTNPDAVIIIKSTVPVGFTESLRKKLNFNNIIFSPEFLREGKALWDNLYPSRIIVGTDKDDVTLMNAAIKFATLLTEGAVKENIDVLYMNSTEAEAVKLFANTYLALRVSFFNELDTYALVNGLDTKSIVDGVCLDSRIGDFYNNPSFGYGGYCLPKDTKQLLANYNNVPQNIISAVVESNKTRKQFIADRILQRNPQTVGIYRLTMKTGSDNFRNSSIQDVMRILQSKGIDIVVYEPTVQADRIYGNRVIKNIDEFKKISDVIIANRCTDEIKDIREKVYTRDIYYRD